MISAPGFVRIAFKKQRLRIKTIKGKKSHKYLLHFAINSAKMFFIHKMIGVSPSGKATVFDTVIRWFESSHPNQKRAISSVGRAADS